MKAKEYMYLILRVRDGVKFVTYGNFKEAYIYPKYLYQLVDETYPYGEETPWGKRKNTTVDGISLEDGGYKVIYQIACK